MVVVGDKEGFPSLAGGSVACRSSIPEVTCPPASLSRKLTHCAIPLILVEELSKPVNRYGNGEFTCQARSLSVESLSRLVAVKVIRV